MNAASAGCRKDQLYHGHLIACVWNVITYAITLFPRSHMRADPAESVLNAFWQQCVCVCGGCSTSQLYN